jgi:hypothetical protein
MIAIKRTIVPPQTDHDTFVCESGRKRPRTRARRPASEREAVLDRLNLLKQLSFGTQVAEDEVASLQEYFVRTDQWSRIVRGDIDVVRGEKGAGKSALYLLLNKNKEDLFDRRILIVSGENPRGTTVFKDLIADPPASEREFIVLWKLYILVVVCHELREFDISGGSIRSVYGALEEQGLLERDLNLAGLLRLAQSFARRLLGAKPEIGVELDPNTAQLTGVIGKIALAEPPAELRTQGITSLDGMFTKVNAALAASDFKVWVLLDRLDVAFAESHALEANAIRALVRVYSDLGALDQLSLKIFLREDIWQRVTGGGFREACHIVRFEVMNWTSAMLLNLALRRILNNDPLCEQLGIDREEVLADSARQDEIFSRIFPPQIEQGIQKATTFNWMIARCADGTGKTAPREFIHLLNCVKDEEIKRLERGGNPAPHDQLFDRSVFKSALPTVSNTRLTTYLYAEYPAERPYLEKREGEKTEHTPESLAAIWNMTRDEASAKAADLVALGFFEARGTRVAPTFWVPFLYRDALNLVQGKADLADSLQP